MMLQGSQQRCCRGSYTSTIKLQLLNECNATSLDSWNSNCNHVTVEQMTRRWCRAHRSDRGWKWKPTSKNNKNKADCNIGIVEVKVEIIDDLDITQRQRTRKTRIAPSTNIRSTDNPSVMMTKPKDSTQKTYKKTRIAPSTNNPINR
jgi:hypothetical protein